MKILLFALLTCLVSTVTSAFPIVEEPKNDCVLVVGNDHTSSAFAALPAEIGTTVDSGFVLEKVGPTVLLIGDPGAGSIAASLRQTGLDVILIDPVDATPLIPDELKSQIPIERFNYHPAFISSASTYYDPTTFHFEGYLNKIPPVYKSYLGEVYKGERAHLAKA